MKIRDLILREAPYSQRPGGNLWQLQGDPRDLPSYRSSPQSQAAQQTQIAQQLQQAPNVPGATSYPVQQDLSTGGTYMPGVPASRPPQSPGPASLTPPQPQQVSNSQIVGPYTGTQIMPPNAGAAASLPPQPPQQSQVPDPNFDWSRYLASPSEFSRYVAPIQVPGQQAAVTPGAMAQLDPFYKASGYQSLPGQQPLTVDPSSDPNLTNVGRKRMVAHKTIRGLVLKEIKEKTIVK